MLAENIISAHLPFVGPDATIQHALEYMQRFNVLHLPIVDNGKFIGNVGKMYLEQLEDASDTLLDHLTSLPLDDTYVQARQHFFDIIDLVNSQKLTVVPIVNQDDVYIGATGLPDIIQALNNLTASDEPGYIVVLNIPKTDYSLTELAGIVESNNSRIITLYMSASDNPSSVHVNLKISGDSSSKIVMSFQRYGYDVVYVFTDAQQVSDSKEHYDALMRYLNI